MRIVEGRKRRTHNKIFVSIRQRALYPFCCCDESHRLLSLGRIDVDLPITAYAFSEHVRIELD
jgi:hypothetical protein